MKHAYDVIVVGLGHAGSEAALACARMGLDTLALTLKRERAAVMSCNPAVGGTAKGHLVRELDALGGEMARVADLTGTHFKTLNGSKGPAVQATRVLCDRLWQGSTRGRMRQVGCERGVALAQGRLDASSIDSSFAASEDKSAVCRARTGVTRFDAHALDAVPTRVEWSTSHAIVWIARGWRSNASR